LENRTLFFFLTEVEVCENESLFAFSFLKIEVEAPGSQSLVMTENQ